MITTTSSSTVGEVITDTKTVSGSFTINQGFQQTSKKTSIGIEEQNLTIDYSLYPNPAINEINLKLESQKPVDFKIFITNSLGQKISKETEISFIKSWNGMFDVQDYASGIYFLTILNKNQNIFQTIQFLKK